MVNPPAFRLLFHHQGSNVELRTVVEVDIIPPPSHPLGTTPSQMPFYFELQDEHGQLLYRRATTHPFPEAFEVPTGDPDTPFRYEDAEGEPEGAFSVLVPNVDAGRFVELRSSLGDQDFSLGRFELEQADDSWPPPPGLGG